MSIGVTDHAAFRFRQRVRPDLNQEEARRFLIKAIDGAEIITEKPFTSSRNADGWIDIDFGVYLVLRRRTNGYGGFSTVTCIVNPSMHVRQRAA